MLCRGQSLFSLLLSLTLSSFLLLVILAFYTRSQQQNQQAFALLQLQSEVQRAVQLMGKDLRRAGFRAASEKVVVHNFSLFEQEKGQALALFSRKSQQEADCVLFFYDIDGNGCVGGTFKNGRCVENNRNATRFIERELFGYRLDKGMLETRLTYRRAVNAECKQKECQEYLQARACESGGWVDLFDLNLIEVQHLHFSWLIEHRLLQIDIRAQLKNQPHLTYATQMIVPLLNGE